MSNEQERVIKLLARLHYKFTHARELSVKTVGGGKIIQYPLTFKPENSHIPVAVFLP